MDDTEKRVSLSLMVMFEAGDSPDLRFVLGAYSQSLRRKKDGSSHPVSF